MVGDNRFETRLKILLKLKTNKIVLEPERYSGFYLGFHRMLQEVERAEVTSLLPDNRGLDTA